MHSQEYLRKLRNPDSLVSSDLREEPTYSRDLGILTIEETDTPRTVFHYYKRSNWTANNATREEEIKEESHYAQAVSTAKATDPTLRIRTPGLRTNLSQQLLAFLQYLSIWVDLTKEEEVIFQAAVKRLHDKPSLKRKRGPDGEIEYCS
jgi:hypothetical protein